MITYFTIVMVIETQGLSYVVWGLIFSASMIISNDNYQCKLTPEGCEIFYINESTRFCSTTPSHTRLYYMYTKLRPIAYIRILAGVHPNTRLYERIY